MKRVSPDHWDGTSYVKAPKQTGRAQSCVEHVTCPHCKAKPGKLCVGKNGPRWATHYLRRYAYHIYRCMWKGYIWPAHKEAAIRAAGGPMPSLKLEAGKA